MRPKAPSNHLRQADRGGLPKAQFQLWQALGDQWQPQYWMSPLGELGDDVVYFQIDLALPEKHLAVEVDGRSHRYIVEQDQRRDQWLIRNGWTVLRFSDEEIRTSIEFVVERIRTQENAA
jgi:very-short-patch-repair endonuclease